MPYRAGHRSSSAFRRSPADMMRWLAFWLMTVSLGAAVVLKGGVSAEQWEWIALAISLASAIWMLSRSERKPSPEGVNDTPWGSIFLTALLVWMVLQLVPLPPAWVRLLSPLRWDDVAAARQATGQANGGWTALSLAPGVTTQRLLDVIPAMAAFLAACQMGWLWRDRLWVAVAPVIGIAGIESLVGLLQFYSMPAEGDTPVVPVSGTYVNRNHFAGLLEMAFPLALMAVVAAWRAGKRRTPGLREATVVAAWRTGHSRRGGRSLSSTLAAVALAGVAACLLLGIILSQSRMGVISTLIAVVVLILGVGLSFLPTSSRWLGGLRWGILIAVPLLLVVSLPPELVLRFADPDLAKDARGEIWRNSLPIISAYKWTGVGLGAFERGLYRYKTVMPTMTVDFAHNDFLQILAELGIVGAALAGALALWILWQPLKIVIRERKSAHWPLAAGVLAALMALLVHSLADFNLYIPSNALVFAWLSGIAVSLGFSGRPPMRMVFPVAAFAIAAFSIVLDYRHVDPNSWYCRAGLCRFDQIFASPPHPGGLLTDVAALVNEDPSNPMVWCTYAELLSAQGRTAEATSVFDRAVSLGPGMSPVLMRAATFDFSYGREDEGFQIANRILRQTDAFDRDLFEILNDTGIGTAALLGTAVPATPRAARSWLALLREEGSDNDLLKTWAWMRKNGLADQKSAVSVTSTLWERKSYRSAQKLWADWLGPADGRYLRPQRLTDTHFENEPDGSPFDWTVDISPSVEISRRDGLNVRFTGTENIAFGQVHQFATASPGPYRLSVEISADSITTDQGPFFHVFDPTSPNRLSVETAQIKGSVSKSWLKRDFEVPPGTEALEVQIERRPSLRFDDNITGVLHVYQVSLVPLP